MPKREKKGEMPNFDDPKYVQRVLAKYGRKSTGNPDVDRVNARNLMGYSEGDARTGYYENPKIDGASEDHRGD